MDVMTAKERSARDFLAHAEHISRRQGSRLTPLRRLVLQIIAEQSRPITAYQLLRCLHQYRPGAAPTAIYRSVEFLTRHRLVQRVVSMRAYTCAQLGEIDVLASGAAPMLICERCRNTFQLSEMALAADAIQAIRQQGFVVYTQHVEVHGICAACQAQEVDG